MTLTGPQKVPFASTAYWYGDDYPGSAMESNVVVVHTTEGRTLPSYGGGASAPNITGVPDFTAKTIRWYQHFDVDRSSRALVNASGGVETNTLNSFQVELVGTCDPTTHARWGSAEHIYWPEAPDWALAGVARLLKWLNANHGVPLRSSVTWKAYPASYGTSNGVRLSGSEWTGYYGVLGHQHVPENLHGDPGNIDMDRILALAAGAATEEEDVALTDADIEKIAKKVLTLDGVIDNPNPDTATANPFISLESSVRNIETVARRAEKKVDSLAVAGVDLDALAVKVADELYRRMAS